MYADARLLRLLSDDLTVDVLRLLLEAPSRHRDIAAKLKSTPAAVSRCVGGLEDAGLVRRESLRAPVELIFRDKTQELLLAAGALAAFALEEQARDASERVRRLRRQSMGGAAVDAKATG